MYRITVLPDGRVLQAAGGENLLALLRRERVMQEAPCGGQGTCGKCRVTVNGAETLACTVTVKQDLTVTLPTTSADRILTDAAGTHAAAPCGEVGYCLAVDIGTTTLAACLLDGTSGEALGFSGMLNPQSAYGADVVTRIRHAQKGHAHELTEAVRDGVQRLIGELCAGAGIAPEEITDISVVGNPLMQQLFLGMPTDNLTHIPFHPVLTRAETVNAERYLPICRHAALQIVPDISAYVGADTVGCLLETDLDRMDKIALLIDIGTNGEMVLGNRHRMLACSTAAGPALEGANIRFGMRAREGAIDHVKYVDGAFHCSVIGGGEATGICGSGLIDAVAAALDAGLLNERGRIGNDERLIRLTDRVWLTQEDIREVQLAKGAIAAGIALMAQQFGVDLAAIETVYLAGAFGTYMDPSSACRIGLLPSVLRDKVVAAGNAALAGAVRMVLDGSQLMRAQQLREKTECISLAELPEFSRRFAACMRFNDASEMD